jgi:hypothetical protein
MSNVSSINITVKLQGIKNKKFWEVKVTLRLAVYCQSVHFGAKILETHVSILFFQLRTSGYSPYVTPSLTRRWVCLLWICLVLSRVRIAHIACYWKFFLCATYKSSVSTGFTVQIMPIFHILCYNGSLVIWTVVSLTTAKFKPLIFSTSGFTLSSSGKN